MVRIAFLTLLTIISVNGFSQGQNLLPNEHHLRMTLDEAISTAREQSPAAMIAKYNFLAGYWRYRTFKAKFLPSLNLNATLGSYSRYLAKLQDAETGKFNYVENNNMSNSLSLSVDQNIGLTGGTLSLTSSLNRLDQFAPYDNLTYNSTPVSLVYSQPINGYNSFRWEKMIEPKEYDRIQKVYLESMESINIEAADRFFSVLSAQKNLEMAEKNYAATQLSVSIAEKRYEIGSITNNELLQLKMSLYNAQLEINDGKMNFESEMLKLRSYLGYNESVIIELIMPEMGPEIQLDYSDVLDRALKNSSENLSNELDMLAARQEVAEAKSNAGLNAKLFAQFGVNQKGEKLADSYRNPMDQEIVGLSLSLPILDWGLGRGKIKLAKSREEIAKTQIEQTESEYRQEILIKVMQFNNQKMQCSISARNDSIAKLRYDITMERFKNGSISVTELNTAQTEKDNAVKRYISDLNNYWKYFYSIRKISLYDYLDKKEIVTDFNLLTEN
ncbi:MAG: TolC family protein [Bacteroidales bacterium]|nr:TolC family protein [Bacteroidales bacterium]